MDHKCFSKDFRKKMFQIALTGHKVDKLLSFVAHNFKWHCVALRSLVVICVALRSLVVPCIALYDSGLSICDIYLYCLFWQL